ncbi:MAG: hypothetical protein IJZ92_06405 [Bacteroidaceae bacterium]|nr:hypothetical protein [Bacteroidaceae bacterium]
MQNYNLPTTLASVLGKKTKKMSKRGIFMLAAAAAMLSGDLPYSAPWLYTYPDVTKSAMLAENSASTAGNSASTVKFHTRSAGIFNKVQGNKRKDCVSVFS